MKTLTFKDVSFECFLTEHNIDQSVGENPARSRNNSILLKKSTSNLDGIDTVKVLRNEHTNVTGTKCNTTKEYLIIDYDDYCWELKLKE